MKTFCPIDDSPMIAVNKTSSTCKLGCKFDTNTKELWEMGLSTVHENGVGFLTRYRYKALGVI